MGRERCAIICPVYKQAMDLSVTEILSLRLMFKTFSERDIIFIGPQNINYEAYETLGKGKMRKRFMFTDEHAFEDVLWYNKLCLTTSFYELWGEYEYILLCQLDTLSFNDNLDFFCDLGYDYIGAIMEDNYFAHGEKYLVGNGGYSLRKVSSMIKCSKEYYDSIKDINYRKLNNEDIIISTLWKNSLKIAPTSVANMFSWELGLEHRMEETDGALPMGCHGYAGEKTYKFWLGREEIQKIICNL